ncbi:amidase [Bradyrhizobium sp. USDA 4524]|uniref:amidase n=1 Tax=unclassified Bradyrhizobium TaxID=2631580 RepID=UPI0020A160A3|nr:MULTISPECIES: amidase [unclassified Bradyrhizobium]MCP1845820.1 amidase [Bradyrhizobium sp. USDA 4538]MCP1906857.1 amidase [Bradyrhizobium sp. USDA 4537]MCP1985332.1 amidase [Bradyrhizobium sp. USDA 4539]
MAASNRLAMSWAEWGKHDAIALAELIRAKEVSVREIVAQAAAAIERLNPQLGAVIEVYENSLENADVDGPDRAGKLYGVPMLLKDIGLGLKGRTQEYGSKLYRDNVVTATDPVVENFLSAGLIPIGRSTTPEFGMSFDTTTDYLGKVMVTRNPWNLERTPGGSSGGSAAAVAAGIVPIGTSSDGGGSTRIPASFSGLVGLKASRGRVARPLAESEYISRLTIDGVITRTVRDTAVTYDLITRIPEGGTFIPIAPPVGSYLELASREPGKLRIGLSTGRWGRGTDTDSEVSERVRAVGTVLDKFGHAVEEIDDALICDWEALWEGHVATWISSRAQLRKHAEKRGINEKDLERYLTPMVYRHYLAAERYDKFDIWRIMERNNQVTREFGRFMSGFDLLLTPTFAIRPQKANGPYSLLRDQELEPWVARLCDACRYLMPGNETGMPSISVPAGLDHEGLPIGVLLHAKWGREDLLLQIATQLESSKPEWFGATPPVYV